MVRKFGHMGEGRVEVVVVGGQCGGQPGERDGFSEEERVGDKEVGRVEVEQEPIGGSDGA